MELTPIYIKSPTNLLIIKFMLDFTSKLKLQLYFTQSYTYVIDFIDRLFSLSVIKFAILQYRQALFYYYYALM